VIETIPYQESSYCTKPCPLGQAGCTLEKQVARDDQPGDHRSAKLDRERGRGIACELAERGRRTPIVEPGSPEQGRRFSLDPFPRAAVRIDGPEAWPLCGAASPTGRTKSQELSGAQNRTDADDLASRIRHIPAGREIRSLAEGSKIVPKNLAELQDTPTSGRSRGGFVIPFTLSRCGNKKGVRSSIQLAEIMAVVDFGVFWRL
jgi:hypothetical protein